MNVEIIFGIDMKFNNIFVIKKNDYIKIISEEPTASQWGYIVSELNISIDEERYIKKKFEEWKKEYK